MSKNLIFYKNDYYKRIFIDGNIQLTKEHRKLLEKYEVLYFGNKFNQKLENIPPNIKAIIFRKKDEYNNFEFIQPLGNLHPNLEYLYLNGTTIDNLDNLPLNLKYLILKCDVLSNSINYLPEGLEYLVIYTNYVVINSFPSGLKELYLYGIIEKIELPQLPYGLKKLYINLSTLDEKTNINLRSIKFPDTLEILIIKYNIANPLEGKVFDIMEYYLENAMLPKNIKKIILPTYMCLRYEKFKKLGKYLENVSYDFVNNGLEENARHILEKYQIPLWDKPNIFNN